MKLLALMNHPMKHPVKHWEAEGVVFQMKCESKALEAIKVLTALFATVPVLTPDSWPPSKSHN